MTLFLSGGLINHISSHNQQRVSDPGLFLCQAVSSIMSHPMGHDEQYVSDTALFPCEAASH